jgi:hypothetical protein
MPRYTARPVTIEAFQWLGHTHELPEAFRMVVTRHLQAGGVEVMTGDGARQCRHYDWIVRGPEGQFSVLKAAAFEAGFEEQKPSKTLTLVKGKSNG